MGHDAPLGSSTALEGLVWLDWVSGPRANCLLLQIAMARDAKAEHIHGFYDYGLGLLRLEP
jgi:hypothetical protein